MPAGRKLLLASAVLAGGIALAHRAVAQAATPTRFDPFHPELSLNAPDAGPATQPTATDPAADPSPFAAAPRPRPIIRDPLRPPTRSPFRP